MPISSIKCLIWVDNQPDKLISDCNLNVTAFCCVIKNFQTNVWISYYIYEGEMWFYAKEGWNCLYQGMAGLNCRITEGKPNSSDNWLPWLHLNYGPYICVQPSKCGYFKLSLSMFKENLKYFPINTCYSYFDFNCFMQLENNVRLLLELEPESDPVWHYLNIQVRTLRSNHQFLFLFLGSFSFTRKTILLNIKPCETNNWNKRSTNWQDIMLHHELFYSNC